jgi:NAD(P)H dehydrogenase (quinone)
MSVTPVNVLVIFSSLCGNTETLALAAAVGAVQARASIRMRRLPDTGESVPDCKETLARMRKEYVPPTSADTQWADAVIIGMNGTIAGVATDPAEATAFGRRAANQARERKTNNQ